MLLDNLQSLFFELLLFLQKLFILLFLCLTDLEGLNSRILLFLMALHLANFLVDITQLLLDLALLLFEHGNFLHFPFLIKINGLQFLMLRDFKLLIDYVVMNVALPNGQGLQQFVFHIDGHMVQFPLQMVPHGPKIIRLIAHKQMVNPPLSVPHE